MKIKIDLFENRESYQVKKMVGWKERQRKRSQPVYDNVILKRS